MNLTIEIKNCDFYRSVVVIRALRYDFLLILTYKIHCTSKIGKLTRPYSNAIQVKFSSEKISLIRPIMSTPQFTRIIIINALPTTVVC